MQSNIISASVVAVFYAIAGAISLWLIAIWWLMPKSVSPLLFETVPPTYPKIVGTLALVVIAVYFTNQPERIAKKFPVTRAMLSLASRVRIIALILEILSISVFLWVLMPRVSATASRPNEMVTVLTLTLLVVGTVGRILKRGMPIASTSGRKLGAHNEVSIDQILSRTVKPVLYLRSFEKELRGGNLSDVFSYATAMNPHGMYMSAHTSSQLSLSGFRLSSLRTGRSMFDEQMIFGEFFRRYAPYVTALRFDQFTRTRSLGAENIVLNPNSWKRDILRLIQNSQVIVIEAADTDSLGWELAQVVHTVPPRRVLLIAPRKQKEWEDFLKAHEGVFPKGLPDRLPKSRLVMFDNDWTARELPNTNMCVADSLAPFCARISLIHNANSVAGKHRTLSS